MMKAYRCYGINGKKEIIAFTPKHGDTDADEVELYLQPYCNEAENADGVKAIEYKGSLYFDWMFGFRDEVVYVNTYKDGDAYGNPTGEKIAIATLKK